MQITCNNLVSTWSYYDNYVLETSKWALTHVWQCKIWGWKFFCACTILPAWAKDESKHISKNPWIYHWSGNGVRLQHCVGIFHGKQIFKHVCFNVFKLAHWKESWSHMHNDSVCSVRGEWCIKTSALGWKTKQKPQNNKPNCSNMLACAYSSSHICELRNGDTLWQIQFNT